MDQIIDSKMYLIIQFLEAIQRVRGKETQESRVLKCVVNHCNYQHKKFKITCVPAQAPVLALPLYKDNNI